MSMEGRDLAELLEPLSVNAEVATALDSILTLSDTLESEGRQMKQCWINYWKNKKNPPINKKIVED
jgi:hypothetical protein